jgi:hypothetical protein
MATHTWTYHQSTNGAHKPAGVKQPRYLAKHNNSEGDGQATVKGVPYAWGRMDATDAVGGTGTSFDALVKAGTYTGNTAEVSASTTGVDCSGLVSVTFSIPKIGSGSLIGSKYFKSVKMKNRKPGDIIQHPGHVVIYLGAASKDPQTHKPRVWIAESTTTRKHIDRVIVWRRPASAFGTWKWGRYTNFDARGLDD